jgi:sulfur-oxidizing protein SoxY
MNRLYLLLLGLLFGLGAPQVQAAQPPDGVRWASLKEGLFGSRFLQDDSGARLSLEMPDRAADASAVPLAITVRAMPGDPGVRKLYLVIDKNPSPVGAIFEFGAARNGVALEIRVRIEDYTWVRVIAEREDGSLIAAKHYIKAAGGCSAPAGKSLAERHAGMGQMKWRVDGSRVSGGDQWVQLLIRHPNDSGLAMDQLTRLYDPPMFVNNVIVTRGDMLIFSAQVDFSISQNPAFRFTLPAGGSGDLRAQVSDTEDRFFESTFSISDAPWD